MRPRRARLGCKLYPITAVGLAAHASMRPRRARLGCVKAGGGWLLYQDASMRPRRARLGCALSADHRGAGESASMRPRRARLGCEKSKWKLYLGPMGFNEAEARAPRMSGAVFADRRDHDRASMRPRRARLGCHSRNG